jgi:hypothetical protein
MATRPIVPDDFDVPLSLTTRQYRLERLGPQHNEADHAAWTGSIEHIRATPGFPYGQWPPLSGMSLADNLADLRHHAQDFAQRTGFTYTVLDAATGDVIGCVYIYPSRRAEADGERGIDVRSWVRADRAELDDTLYRSVATWLAEDWPFASVSYRPR